MSYSMGYPEFTALAPLIAISVTAVVLMMQVAFYRNALAAWVITCLGLAIALALVPKAAGAGDIQIPPLLAVDRYGSFFSALVLFASLVTGLLSRDYLSHQLEHTENEEFYLLLLLAAAGGVVLVLATHLASFLLGLELLGVSLYAMIAYPDRGLQSLEAATKYLVLSGAASAVLLFGFALIYAVLGDLSFAGIGQRLQSLGEADILILAGTALVLAGVGFKLSLVPFHMWTPDVYQGAPVLVTGFLATVSKAAIFAALLRLFLEAELHRYPSLLVAISVLAVASMLAGNLLALLQDNIKRLLAYSSIAHLGYLMVAVVAGGVLGGGALAGEAASYYLVAYVLTTLAAFSVIGVLSSWGVHSGGSSGEQDAVASLEGLFWRHPVMATVMTVALLSLAGIPLTVGFVGKFYLFTVGIEGALWVLLAALVVGSGIGIYYYLRVIYAMSKFVPADSSGNSHSIGIMLLGNSVVLLLVAMVLALGIYPQPLMAYVQAILPSAG